MNLARDRDLDCLLPLVCERRGVSVSVLSSCFSRALTTDFSTLFHNGTDRDRERVVVCWTYGILLPIRRAGAFRVLRHASATGDVYCANSLHPSATTATAAAAATSTICAQNATCSRPSAAVLFTTTLGRSTSPCASWRGFLSRMDASHDGDGAASLKCANTTNPQRANKARGTDRVGRAQLCMAPR